MSNIFSDRLGKFVGVLFLYAVLVSYLTKYSPNYATLWLLVAPFVLIFVIKYLRCPNCDWPALLIKGESSSIFYGKTHSWFPDCCDNCGFSFYADKSKKNKKSEIDDLH